MRRGFTKTIYIEDFIRTGRFGSVDLGQSVDTLRKTFPKPDDVSRMSEGTYIWRYGAFEFHFIHGILTLL